MMGNSKKRMGCVVNINSNLVRRESVSVVRVMWFVVMWCL